MRSAMVPLVMPTVSLLQVIERVMIPLVVPTVRVLQVVQRGWCSW